MTSVIIAFIFHLILSSSAIPLVHLTIRSWSSGHQGQGPRPAPSIASAAGADGAGVAGGSRRPGSTCGGPGTAPAPAGPSNLLGFSRRPLHD